MSALGQHRFQKLKEASQSIEAWCTRDSDGTLTLSLKKPTKDRSFGWLVPKGGSTEQNHYMFLKDEMLPQITAEDKEPTKITISIG